MDDDYNGKFRLEREWCIQFCISELFYFVVDKSPQIQGIHLMLIWCWSIVYDAGPTSNQYWIENEGLSTKKYVSEMNKICVE